jgi:hypothetical protein
MTPEEILAKAAEDQAEHGHHKGSFYSSRFGQSWETAPACAYGSMARVARLTDGRGMVDGVDDPVISKAAAKLADAIRPHVPVDLSRADTYTVITSYNDSHSITAEDMILRFKEAAHG